MKVCSEYVKDVDSINVLDKFKENTAGKFLFVREILAFKKLLPYQNKVGRELFVNSIKFNENNDLNDIDEIKRSFEKYFIEKEYILEHYAVNYIYKNLVSSLEIEECNKIIIGCILNYISIKYILLVTWYTRNQTLNREDIINVIYSYSRLVEHDSEYSENVYNAIKEINGDNLEVLIYLLK